MNQNKTTQNDQSVEAFLGNVEPLKKREDAQKLLQIFNEESGLQPKMWGSSIIGYGQYHYKYESGREGDFMRTGFSPRKQNLTLYIMNGFKKMPHLLEKLGKHKTGKSCLYINKLADIDENVLRQVIRADLQFMEEKYGPNPS